MVTHDCTLICVRVHISAQVHERKHLHMYVYAHRAHVRMVMRVSVQVAQVLAYVHVQGTREFALACTRIYMRDFPCAWLRTYVYTHVLTHACTCFLHARTRRRVRSRVRAYVRTACLCASTQACECVHMTEHACLLACAHT